MQITRDVRRAKTVLPFRGIRSAKERVIYPIPSIFCQLEHVAQQPRGARGKRTKVSLRIRRTIRDHANSRRCRTHGRVLYKVQSLNARAHSRITGLHFALKGRGTQRAQINIDARRQGRNDAELSRFLESCLPRRS